MEYEFQSEFRNWPEATKSSNGAWVMRFSVEYLGRCDCSSIGSFSLITSSLLTRLVRILTNSNTEYFRTSVSSHHREFGLLVEVEMSAKPISPEHFLPFRLLFDSMSNVFGKPKSIQSQPPELWLT